MSDIEISNFADDNTPCMSPVNTTSLVKSIESTACWIFKRFPDNQLKGNSNKCHVLLSNKEKVLKNVNSTHPRQ